MKTNLRCEIVEVTPSLAKEWLELNCNFRDAVSARVETMAADMRAARWDENGESIKFSNKDELVDGQHRLMACVKAEKPFVSVVVYGVKNTLNIDNGSPRQLFQWLKHNGCEKYTKEVAATLRGVIQFVLGRAYIPQGGLSNRSATNSELVALFKRDPSIEACTLRCITARTEGVKYIPLSVLSTLFHQFQIKDAVLAETFLEALAETTAIALDDPVAQLRRKLQANQLSKCKMSVKCVAALTIMAWNHWRNGTGTKLLKWAESGPTAMAFPEIE